MLAWDNARLHLITRAVKRKLKMLQYRPQVIDGCFTETALRFDEATPAATSVFTREKVLAGRDQS
ncbi:hypothetical protein AB0M92_23955 [Streptomyces sp. NPDC051582]|uniref:hypothetical protein n=1 Tax=Streptomyces sp. NPDC051582 TaxID=3155167 RepID=UPI00341E38C8